MTEEQPMNKAASVIKGFIGPATEAIAAILPTIIELAHKLHEIYVRLPLDTVHLIIGFIYCFFGGIYPTLFAAIQAAEHGGLIKVKQALNDLIEEAIKIIEANKKDKDKDDDDSQTSARELLLQKTDLILTKVNPEKVDQALGSLYTVWVSVLATLTIQFARTIALSLAISDSLKKPINRYVAPTILSATPKEYQKWVPVVLGWIVKSIAMSLAWYIQSVISALSSAIAGGLIMARSIMKICIKKGIDLGGLIPEKHEDTMLDEVGCYIFAACGFMFQLRSGFEISFPFNIVLWPLGLAEYYIRWSVTGS